MFFRDDILYLYLYEYNFSNQQVFYINKDLLMGIVINELNILPSHINYSKILNWGTRIIILLFLHLEKFTTTINYKVPYQKYI